MENNKTIVPPHLNAEVYRSDTTGTSTLSYLDYIRIHPDGTILIGCSELTGRYWNGGVNITQCEGKDKKFNKTEKKNISLPSGTGDGCFVENSNKVLLCEDSGAVSVWTTSDEAWKQWTEELSVAEHDDMVLSVDCLESGKKYITAGADGNVKVWDICDLVCVRNYDSAHTMAVNTVSVRPKSHTFATGSLDQYISLWDENIFQPVCDIVKNNCGIRCLQWLDENCLVFGDDAGVLSLLDIRKPGDGTKLAEFPAAVHQIAVKSGTNKLAVCCDNKTVTVCDIMSDSKINITYKNGKMHNGFVRGLSWDVRDEDVLYSVGWDGELCKHNINEKRTKEDS
ncbi:methylosome protein 50-like [Papilio machaon]|nr:methylosome protein 50-like [Papilio machaon]